MHIDRLLPGDLERSETKRGAAFFEFHGAGHLQWFEVFHEVVGFCHALFRFVVERRIEGFGDQLFG